MPLITYHHVDGCELNTELTVVFREIVAEFTGEKPKDIELRSVPVSSRMDSGNTEPVVVNVNMPAQPKLIITNESIITEMAERLAREVRLSPSHSKLFASTFQLELHYDGRRVGRVYGAYGEPKTEIWQNPWLKGYARYVFAAVQWIGGVLAH